MIEEKKNTPDYECGQYKQMAARWPYVSDVIEGTLRMRQLGEKYLPKFPSEDKEIYKNRNDTAVCFDATGKTRGGLVGLIFRKDPTLGEEVPAPIKEQLENADLEGTHWTVFAKEVADAVWEFGHSLIFVDMQPEPEAGANAAGTVTHEDDITLGRRPYLVHYKPDQLINWRTAKVNGQTILQQVTFKECSLEPDGDYADKEVTRYRVVRRIGSQVQWTLYLYDKTKQGKEAFIDEGHGTFKNITEIPLSVAYARKTGFLTSRPPLLNLALLNIKHYQQASEYDNTLHIVGYPVMWTDGLEDDEDVKPIGPSLLMKVEKGCQVGYAEPEGSSLEHQEKNLETKKQEMAIMGISFLAERVEVEQTATEQKINHSERTSDLATMVRSFKDAFERALGFYNQFMGGKTEKAGTVEMADPSELVLSTEDIRLLSDLIMRGQCDNDTMWAMMKKSGRLPSNFDPEKVKENIGKVQPTL